jgi:hypothetical protein
MDDPNDFEWGFPKAKNQRGTTIYIYIAILPGRIPLYSHFPVGKSYYIVIFPWGKTGYGGKWLYNASIVVFPPSHFSGGGTDYGAKAKNRASNGTLYDIPPRFASN